MFENLLDPVLNPLLNVMHPLLVTILLALLISVVVTLLYKLLTDQKLMKQLKGEMKELQKEMKLLKDNPEKMMTVQKKAMETNMKYMGKSLKPTLFTLIPLLIIFGWMHAHLAYLPIMPDQQFTTTAEFSNFNGVVSLNIPEGILLMSNSTQATANNQASWLLKGSKGEYLIEYSFGGESHTQEILISDKLEYAEPIKKVSNSNLKTLSVNNQKLELINLGFMKLGWLGTYIIFSLIFSMTLRKIMKIA